MIKVALVIGIIASVVLVDIPLFLGPAAMLFVGYK